MKPTFLLGTIGVALTAWVGYNAVYVPQRAQVRVISTRIAEEQGRQRTRADVEALLEKLEGYRARLPQEPDVSWLVREAVAAAQRTGISLTSITQATPQSSESFTRLSVSLKTQASYHAVGAFLDELERAGRFIHVDRLQVQSQTPPTVELVLSTMYVPASVQPAGTGGAL